MRAPTLTSILVLGLAATTAHAGSCDAVYTAGIKTVQAPHHQVSTTTRGGKVTSSEAILAGGVEYVQSRGVWRRSATTAQAALEAAQEKLKEQPDTCSPAGDATVDGQAVAVYRVRNNEFGTESEVRVLKSSGLLQGQTAKLPNGDRIESRYEYVNVQAPAGVP